MLSSCMFLFAVLKNWSDFSKHWIRGSPTFEPSPSQPRDDSHGKGDICHGKKVPKKRDLGWIRMDFPDWWYFDGCYGVCFLIIISSYWNPKSSQFIGFSHMDFDQIGGAANHGAYSGPAKQIWKQQIRLRSQKCMHNIWINKQHQWFSHQSNW